MTQPRKPARATYDAVVDLATSPSWGPYAFALVKETYRLTPRGCERAAPEPLEHDMRDEELEPRLKAGTDFWPVKLATDVVVEGSAFALAPVPEMTIAVAVGSVTKRVKVFGRRHVRWEARGNVHFTRPEPFNEVALTWENAYGGVDFRVVDPELADLPADVLTAVLDDDHPGLYPRNPFGKGYLVEPEPVSDFELPQLEDPRDLLTPERVITRDPKVWYRQPLPWSYGWVHPMMFPRFVHFIGAPEAWYPAPDDERLPEVRHGYLASGYRSRLENRPFIQGPSPRFWQGASHGFILKDIPQRAPLRIEGMHPEGRVMAFRLPAPPELRMQVEGRAKQVRPRLHSVVCRPAKETFYVLYGATMEVKRPLIPGIHKHIPVAVSVNNDRPVVCEAPVPVREQLAEAMEKVRKAEERRVNEEGDV